MSMSGFLGGINRTKSIMISNVGGSLLNILFNYIFIFGKIGFPAYGIRGAAIGTVLAGLCQLIYLFTSISLNKNIQFYRILKFQTLDLSVMKNMLRILLPLAVQKMFALAVFLVYESIIGIKALYFFALFFFIEVTGYSFEIIFGGNGWGKYVLFSEFTSNIIFIIGLTLLLVSVFDIGIYGAWIGFALYQVFHALILLMGFVSKKWLHIEVEKGNVS